jgi:hypothetical protein
MRTRPSLTSAYCRRFAGRESLTLASNIRGGGGFRIFELSCNQWLSNNSNGLLEGIAVFDALVFEFMGLVMLALCVMVLAIPSRRPAARHFADT